MIFFFWKYFFNKKNIKFTKSVLLLLIYNKNTLFIVKLVITNFTIKRVLK